MGKVVRMDSRHIPNNISRQVNERHYFECAWCGEKLTERHHIYEFSLGGLHTIDNLILLCPNCHTQVHRKEISTAELITRKSTHAKGDRISGGVQFEISEPVVKLGTCSFQNVPILLMFKEEPLIRLQEKNGAFTLSTRFYNKVGDLIFWMSSNRYWTTVDFTINSKKGELTITNNEDENNKLKFWEKDETLMVEGKNYANGTLIDINPKYVTFGNMTLSGVVAKDGLVGLYMR